MAQGAIAAGTLYYGMRGDTKLPQVATPDIGRTAARLLVEGAPQGTRIVELAGPADLTLQEVADAIGKVAGKPIAAVTVPPQAMIEALRGLGASAEIAAMYTEISVAFNDGRLAWQGKDLIRGSVTIEQRLRELLAK